MALNHFRAKYYAARHFVALVTTPADVGSCLYDSGNAYDVPVAYSPSVCVVGDVGVCGYDSANAFDSAYEYDAALCPAAPANNGGHVVEFSPFPNPELLKPRRNHEEDEALMLCGVI